MPLSILCQQSWLTKEVPVDWTSANVMTIYKKDQKEDLGNYRPARPCAGEGHGADYLECHHMALAGQSGDQAQWVYQK